jgi:hypothetical protein
VKRILIIFAVACLALGLAACGEASTEGDAAAAASSAPMAAETAADEGSGSDEAADESFDDGWVEVITLEGNDKMTSESFTLEGGEQKLDWSFTGDEWATVAFYVEAPDWDIAKDGGFPVIWPDEVGSGSEPMEKEAGEYAVHVEAANCEWTATVLEKR